MVGGLDRLSLVDALLLQEKRAPENQRALERAERTYDVALGRIPFEHRGGFVIYSVLAYPGRKRGQRQ